MNKYTRLSLALFFLLSLVTLQSCTFSTITGNGQPETKNFTNTDFDTIELVSELRAEIVYGETYRVDVTMDSNLFSHFEISQEGSDLSLGFNESLNIIPKTEINCTITLPLLSSLDLTGNVICHFGNVKSADGFILNGSGNSLVGGTLYTDGCGSLNCLGSGNMEFDWYASSITIDVSGAVYGHIYGTAEEVRYNFSGSGYLDSSLLRVKKAYIDISSTASLSVNASDLISGSISGSGVVDYHYEHKPVLDVEISGIGRIAMMAIPVDSEYYQENIAGYVE